MSVQFDPQLLFFISPSSMKLYYIESKEVISSSLPPASDPIIVAVRFVNLSFVVLFLIKFPKWITDNKVRGSPRMAHSISIIIARGYKTEF